MPPPGVRAGGGLVYHFLAAIDIEGFSKLDAREQGRTQQDLDRALDVAARRAGMDRSLWRRQVRGDGELAVLPADTDGPRLVAVYPRELAAALAALNAARHQRPRLRLKLALHHGTLVSGSFGPFGDAPIEVSRLLDSNEVREELTRRTDLDLVLIVSARIFHDVVETRFQDLDPAQYRAVNVTVKGMNYPAYICCVPKAATGNGDRAPVGASHPQHRATPAHLRPVDGGDDMTNAFSGRRRAGDGRRTSNERRESGAAG